MGYISTNGKGAIGRHGFRSIIGVYNPSSAVPAVDAVFRATGVGVGKEGQISIQWQNSAGATQNAFLAVSVPPNIGQFSLSGNDLNPAAPTVSVSFVGCLRSASPPTIVTPVEVGTFTLERSSESIQLDNAGGAPAYQVAGVLQSANNGEVGHAMPAAQPITLTNYAEVAAGEDTPFVTITYEGGSTATVVSVQTVIQFIP
mgnify:CR=1 FL=1